MNAQPQFVTNASGEKVAVILPLEEYETLLEDLADLAAVAEAKDEQTIPWETLKAELADHGLL